MKCPKCLEENTTSRIYMEMGGTVTCMGWMPYYDEEGRHHNHDPNSSTTGGTCSNGHQIVVTSLPKCRHAPEHCDQMGSYKVRVLEPKGK